MEKKEVKKSTKKTTTKVAKTTTKKTTKPQTTKVAAPVKVQQPVKKTKKEEIYEDGWLYVLLLSTLVILISSLSNYKFSVGVTSLSYAVFLLPVVLFITNYITKKYGYKKAVVAISASTVANVLFNIIMSVIIGKNIDLVRICSEFCGYIVGQFVNLTIYYFLLKNTNKPILLVFLTYVFSLLIIYMFYTLISLNRIQIDTYWVGYFTTIGIQSIICLVLAFLDVFIKDEKVA